MIDALREIIAHTYKLGSIETVKISGIDKTTTIDAVSIDSGVILHGEFNQVIPEFTGVFGLPNLDRLNTILECPEYKEDANLTVGTMTKEDKVVPVNIKFENKTGDFINEYRLMGEEIAGVKIPKPNAKFNSLTWHLKFSPSAQAIQKFKYQAQAAGTDENTFVAKTENGNLKFYIGDASTHSGNFIFEPNVKGQLPSPKNWPLKHVMAILNLTGDKLMKISDSAMVITVDSGLAKHDYIVLSFTK